MWSHSYTYTVDREIFTKNLHVDKFSQFVRSVNIFLNFRVWSQPRNCFNSEIFPMYGRVTFVSVVPHVQMWDHTYKCGTTHTNMGPHIQMWDHTYKYGITRTNVGSHTCVNVSHLQILQFKLHIFMT